VQGLSTCNSKSQAACLHFYPGDMPVQGLSTCNGRRNPSKIASGWRHASAGA
jgi:hypothetical protein